MGLSLSSLVPQTPLAGANMGLNMVLNTLFPGAGFLGSLVEGPLEQALGLTGGAPKQGGYAEVGGTAGGTLNALYGGTGTTRGYTPSGADPQLEQYLTNLNSTYNTDLTKLGLAPDPATFALGFDTDPGGTAQSRYTGGVDVGGKLLDTAKDVNAGRGAQGVDTAIGTYGTSLLDTALTAAGATPAQIASLSKGPSATGVTPTGGGNSSDYLGQVLANLGISAAQAAAMGITLPSGTDGTGTGGAMADGTTGGYTFTPTPGGGYTLTPSGGGPTGTAGGNIGSDVGGILSLIQGFMGSANKNAAGNAAVANPLMQYQPGLAAKTNALLTDPSSIFKDPLFTSALDMSNEAIGRTMGANEMGDSGNVLAALQKNAMTSGLSYEDQLFRQLFPATMAGGPAAANILQQGQQQQATNMGSGIAGISDMIARALGLPSSSGLIQGLQRLFSNSGGGGGTGYSLSQNDPNAVPVGDVPPGTDPSSIVPGSPDLLPNPIDTSVFDTSGFDTSGLDLSGIFGGGLGP